MFTLNEGWQWRSAQFSDSLHGVVYLATSNDAERMRRRPLADFSWQLFDPQLYLATLDGNDCAKVCARLASYPWFGIVGAPEFDSSDQSQTAWQQAMQQHVRDNWTGAPPADRDIATAARSALEFQADRGCTHLIAAVPMIAEREDEAETAAVWIDAALGAAEDLNLGQPVIATVAVAEAVLNEGSFSEGGFLDTIADQVTARDGLGGVYIVVAQTQKQHPLCAPEFVTQAYAHLSQAFSKHGYEFVFVNFADTFGVACLGLGASGFATGPTQSLRRLCPAAFLDEGGGLPLPHLYSHRSVAEFLPERELEKIAQLNLIRRVTDLTAQSRPLFQALNAGRTVAEVPAWAEGKNNVTAAASHFIARMIAEGSAYAAIPASQRTTRAESWLDDAAVNQEYLIRRLEGQLQTNPTYAPTSEWLGHVRTYS